MAPGETAGGDPHPRPCRARFARLASIRRRGVGAASGSRVRRRRDEGIRPPQHAPFRHRRLALRVRLLPPATFRIQLAQREFDHAFVSVGAALDDRPVGLRNLAVLEQKPERGRCLAMAAEHQTARGFLVQPMRQHRWARQAEAQRVERGFEIGSALRSLVHGNAGRLVDHQHQPVAVEHAGEHLLIGRLVNVHGNRKAGARLSFAGGKG